MDSEKIQVSKFELDQFELEDEQDTLITVLSYLHTEGMDKKANQVRGRIEEIRFELEEIRKKAMADLLAKYGNTSEKE